MPITKKTALALLICAQSLATVSASAAPAKPPIQLYEMERDFYRLGIPSGKIDGVIDGQTQRALCVWRELTNQDISRALPTKRDIQEIAKTDQLFATTQMRYGLNVNLQCQSAIWIREQLESPMKIFKVSTGRPTFETAIGDFQVGWLIDDWYESRTYPEGWMYRPQFFDRGRALHGSSDDSMVQSYPASHGCVRMIQKDVDYLWDNGFAKGSIVNIYGTWRG
jgi:lipoprotein-anchoring transpeptidase ErfK/SrfK